MTAVSEHAIPSAVSSTARSGPRSFPVVSEDRGFESPCWIWQGAVSTAGYGTRGRPGVNPTKLEQTHRAAYEFAFGPISGDDMVIHHLCEQKRCMNPNHMVVVARSRHIRIHKPELHQHRTGRLVDTI